MLIFGDLHTFTLYFTIKIKSNLQNSESAYLINSKERGYHNFTIPEVMIMCMMHVTDMRHEIEIHPNSKHRHVHGDHKKGPPQFPFCLSIIIIW